MKDTGLHNLGKWQPIRIAGLSEAFYRGLGFKNVNATRGLNDFSKQSCKRGNVGILAMACRQRWPGDGWLANERPRTIYRYRLIDNDCRTAMCQPSENENGSEMENNETTARKQRNRYQCPQRWKEGGVERGQVGKRAGWKEGGVLPRGPFGPHHL